MVKKNSTKTKVQPYEIGELDHYLFGQGNHYEIYKKMGAHEVTKNGKRGVYWYRRRDKSDGTPRRPL